MSLYHPHIETGHFCLLCGSPIMVMNGTTKGKTKGSIGDINRKFSSLQFIFTPPSTKSDRIRKLVIVLKGLEWMHVSAAGEKSEGCSTITYFVSTSMILWLHINNTFTCSWCKIKASLFSGLSSSYSNGLSSPNYLFLLESTRTLFGSLNSTQLIIQHMNYSSSFKKKIYICTS